MKVIFETENQALIGEVNDFIQEWNNSSPSIKVNTSGSTGTPKPISLLKKHMKASARMTGDFLGLKPGENALLCLPVTTIAGKMMIVRSIVLNLDLVVVDIDSSPLLHSNSSFDFAAMVPLQVQNSIQNSDLELIRKLIIGGGTISPALWNAVSSATIECYQTFGMTETISHIAMRRINQKNEPYTALPGVEFGLNNGCLTITAPHLGISDLQTNDVVHLIDPTHFEWLGRIDFVINSGGIKIHPEQVEQALNSFIEIPFFSSSLEDPNLGNKHILCVECSSFLNLTKADLKQFINRHVVPKEIYYFDSFCYTDSGKINRPETLKIISNAKKQVL